MARKRPEKPEPEKPSDALLAEHGWVEAGRGAIIKLGDEAGETLHVRGIYLGTKDGEYGPLLRIRDHTGSVLVVSCPVILASRMEDVAVGDEVSIQFLGWTKTKKGQDARDFKVMFRRSVAAAKQEPLPFV